MRCETKKDAKNFHNIEIVTSELGKLKTALDTMDGGAITESLDNLQKVTLADDIAAVIRSISNNILLAEYDEAETLIQSLLRKSL